jgi:hypothetical protein
MWLGTVDRLLCIFMMAAGLPFTISIGKAARRSPMPVRDVAGESAVYYQHYL